MKLIMVITLICAILILTTAYQVGEEVRSNFTDEEWSIINPKIKKKYAWYIIAIMMYFPFVNWFTCFCMGIGYRKLINELTEDYRKLLKTE